MKTIEQTIQNVFERASNENQRKAQRNKIIKTAISCLCIALMICVGCMGLIGNNPESDDYYILIDVNPSIEITVNNDDVVKAVEALNDDGEKIIKDLELKDKPAEEAVKEITASMIDQGYISEEANSVLVSIEGLNEDRDQEIKAELVDSISETFEKNNLESSIIVQSIPSEDSEIEKLSEEYGISAGKAQLINQILNQNKFLTFEELSVMNIHELNLLKVSYYIDMDNTLEVGTPQEIAYIGSTRATDIAFLDANVTSDSVNAQLECREGMMLYLVEFETEENKYRYRINAVTGEIISNEKIDFANESFMETDRPLDVVGENAALNAALERANMQNSTLIRCKYDRDWVDGTVIYNIYFTDGLYSGKYVVNAVTGEILQYSNTQEYHDRRITDSVIGEAMAKQIALNEDGLIDGNVSKYEMTLNVEEDTLVYNLFYLCNGTKYTVKIDAAEGTILQYEKVVLKDIGAPSQEDGSHISQEG